MKEGVPVELFLSQPSSVRAISEVIEGVLTAEHA